MIHHETIRIEDFPIEDEGSLVASLYEIDARCWRASPADQWEVKEVRGVTVNVRAHPDPARGWERAGYIALLPFNSWTGQLRRWLKESDTLNERFQEACQAAFAGVPCTD